jgi:palmitoyltransferase
MELHQLFVPAVYILILFLGYPSQWLLMRLEPAPLTTNELIFSNIIIILILITYTRSVYIDPGRIPKDWADGEGDVKARKWCRKCDAAKPMRAHHCKSCGR